MTRLTSILSILRQPAIARHLLAWLIVLTVGATLLTPTREAARVRNALLASVAQPASFEWKPQDAPGDFLREKGPKPVELLQATQTIGADTASGRGALERSVRIARHLALGGLHGTRLQLETLDAYRQIVATGEGDCGDYAQVFDGLAYVADIPVRQWGISFDGFGGNGHTFNEIFDAHLGKWVMIDVFRSFYAVDRQSGAPLSTLEFRARMRTSRPLERIRIVPLSSSRSPEFERLIVDYYRAGNDQYFLWWGNNALSYDANPLVHRSRWSRAGQQIAGIVTGIHPLMRIVATDTNAPLVRNLRLAAAIALVWLAAAAALLVATWRQVARLTPQH